MYRLRNRLSVPSGRPQGSVAGKNITISQSQLRSSLTNTENHKGDRRYTLTSCSSSSTRLSVAWILAFCMFLVISYIAFFDRHARSPYNLLLNVSSSFTLDATNAKRLVSSVEVRYQRMVPVSLNGTVVSLDRITKIKESGRTVKPMTPPDNGEETNGSGEYKDGLPDPLETKECQAQYEWQLDSKPICNSVHELDMNAFYFLAKDNNSSAPKAKRKYTKDDERLRLIANGGWRDVWSFYPQDDNKVPHNGTAGTAIIADPPYILKTLRYDIEVNPRNVDRHRRDAMAMERLTSSDNIVDIYSFCGNSGFTAYAGGGDIEDALDELRKEWPPSKEVKLKRLHIAVQAAMGLADLHNFDKEGRPSVAHTDISLNQFVKVGGRFKLNDFNRARFLSENRKTKEICPYFVGGNPGNFRSPEEYLHSAQTEKVDVYSFGNILFTLLTLEEIFNGISQKQVKKMVKRGERPKPMTSTAVWDSVDPIDRALKTAMEMCLATDITARATARSVETFLKERLEEIDPGRLKVWGVATR